MQENITQTHDHGQISHLEMPPMMDAPDAMDEGTRQGKEAAPSPDEIAERIQARKAEHKAKGKRKGKTKDAAPAAGTPSPALEGAQEEPEEAPWQVPLLLDMSDKELDELAQADDVKLELFLTFGIWDRVGKYPGPEVSKFPNSPDERLRGHVYSSSFNDYMGIYDGTNDSIRDVIFRMYGAPCTGADPDDREILFDINAQDAGGYRALYVYDGTAWKRNTLAALDLFEPVKEIAEFYRLRNRYVMEFVLEAFKDALFERGRDITDKSTSKESLLEEATKVAQKRIGTMLSSRKRLEATNFKRQTLEGVCKSENALTTTGQEWDRAEEIQDVFPCANGVIDLATGKCRPGTPKDLFLLRSGVAYDPDNTGDLWRETVLSMMGGDEELAHYLQVVCGAAATRRTSDPTFALLYGEGGNGKGLFLKVLRAAFGELLVSCSPQLLSAAREMDANGPSPALLALRGRALAVMEEADLRSGINDAMIKSLTAGTEVSCRGLYQAENVSWHSTTALFLACNKLPRLRSLDGGTKRRVVSIPFEMTFVTPSSARAKGLGLGPDGALPPGHAWADLTLEKRLREPHELQGVLTWVVEGAREFIAHGLPARPHAVEKQTAVWFNESDTLAAFLDECCEVADPDKNKLPVSNILSRYQAWAEQNGYRLYETSITLSRKLQALRGPDGKPLYVSCKYHGGKAALAGIRFKPEPEPEPEFYAPADR